MEFIPSIVYHFLPLEGCQYDQKCWVQKALRQMLVDSLWCAECRCDETKISLYRKCSVVFQGIDVDSEQRLT